MTPPFLSVVVPTRNESDNVEPLLARLTAAMASDGLRWELLVVDDSDDDTPSRIRAAARRGLPVTLLHRLPGQRVDGLAGAVRSGFAAARGDLVAVMDADLQHPPEVLGRLVAALEEGGDVAVASRYCKGADPDAAEGLDGWWRRNVSRTCRYPVWLLFPRLRQVSDPLSGFFVVRREVVADAPLAGQGFKILLEVLVRGSWSTVVEAPYRFAPRDHGASKATLRQGAEFFRHLSVLRRGGQRDAPGDADRARRLGSAIRRSARRALPDVVHVGPEGAPAGHRAADLDAHAAVTGPERG